MRSFEPPARLRSPWRAPSLPQDQRDLRAPPRIRVSVLSRQRSDQKSLELRIPCVGYLIARGLGAPDADDDRRLSPEHRAPAIRTLSRSRFNCARRLTSSMLVSRRTVRLQTLLLTIISLNSDGRGHDGKLGFVTMCQQCLTDGCRWPVRFTTMREIFPKAANALQEQRLHRKGKLAQSRKRPRHLRQDVGAVRATSIVLMTGSSTQASRANQL